MHDQLYNRVKLSAIGFVSTTVSVSTPAMESKM